MEQRKQSNYISTCVNKDRGAAASKAVEHDMVQIYMMLRKILRGKTSFNTKQSSLVSTVAQLEE